MKLKLLFSLTFLVCCWSAQAQLRGGVKIGLNFSHLEGPSEQDAAGANLETFNNVTGFHIGPTFAYALTDHFGLRGELVYSKRGTKYNYEGVADRKFVYDNNLGSAVIRGTADYQVLINNHYFDLPLSAYARWGGLEVHGGAYASLLVQTVGDGGLSFDWTNLDGTTGSADFNLRHNYRRDDAGGSDKTDVSTFVTKVNGRNVTLPNTIGAYYDYAEDKGNLFRSFDYGVHVGLAYYLSRSLYVSGRLQYGLADLTRNSADQAKQLDASGQPVYRNDRDQNFTIQASVGFSF